MRSIRFQKGASFFTVMMLLVLLGFVALFAIKLVPVYIEYFNVRSVLSSFKTESATYATPVSVQQALQKRFDVNNITAVNASDVEIQPEAGGYALRLDYEARVPFVSNIYLVAKFSEQGQARSGSGE